MQKITTQEMGSLVSIVNAHNIHIETEVEEVDISYNAGKGSKNSAYIFHLSDLWEKELRQAFPTGDLSRFYGYWKTNDYYQSLNKNEEISSLERVVKVRRYVETFESLDVLGDSPQALVMEDNSKETVNIIGPSKTSIYCGNKSDIFDEEENGGMSIKAFLESFGVIVEQVNCPEDEW